MVFIFLQGWRAALIPLAAVPVSLIGTFALFPAVGFSINTLSLFGLVLAIGLVVDDAIVVVEAVEHHIGEGMAPREATLKAMEEVSGPVVAIALILSAVFIPTVFIPGITGRLYQQFAVTIAFAVLISAFNAADSEPRPGRVAPASFAQGKRSFGAVLWRVQSRLWLGSPTATLAFCPQLDSEIRLQPVVSRRCGARRYLVGQNAPVGFSAGGRSRVSLCQRSTPLLLLRWNAPWPLVTRWKT